LIDHKPYDIMHNGNFLGLYLESAFLRLIYLRTNKVTSLGYLISAKIMLIYKY